MKHLITFVFLAVLFSTTGFAAKPKDLSGPIALKGELQQQYENYPVGTPVVIRKVVKNEISRTVRLRHFLCNRNQWHAIRSTFFRPESHKTLTSRNQSRVLATNLFETTLI